MKNGSGGSRLENLRPSDDEVAQNYGHRERFESDEPRLEGLEGAQRAATEEEKRLGALVSPEAHALIEEFEVGGRASYERQYRFPCLPPAPSGITIGIGYDLGYYQPGQFASDWQAFLSPDDFGKLGRALGRKGGAAADLFDANVKRIDVPWAAASRVYREVSVPVYAGLTQKAFPGSELLHGTCFGVLVSLVYNRGSSLKGDSRSEMRDIRDAIAEGRSRDVPDLLRDMKRVWAGRNLAGLLRRRDAEAALFEQGLTAAERERPAVAPAAAPAVVVSAAPATSPTVVAAAAGPAGPRLESFGGGMLEMPSHDGDGRGLETIDYEAPPPGGDVIPRLESLPPWAETHWVDDDALSADYRHLRAEDRARVKDASFVFSKHDLELLIATNHFGVLREGQRIIFGLRGTMLEFDTSKPGDRFAQVDREALRLKACRPNHQHFRCVIGVYNLATGMLSGFTASTVPNRGAVHRCKVTGANGNLLATGCYLYTVGSHSKGRFKGCLRQSEPMAVLRSRKNLVYDVDDVWDIADDADQWPFDNIHPAFADRQYNSAEFSSFGCQVIRGSFVDGEYTEQFAKFRTALGLARPGGDDGRKFSYVLLTGDEAAIAAAMRQEGRTSDEIAVRESLARLRQGSRGGGVEALQVSLQLSKDGKFTAAVKNHLIDVQRHHVDEMSGDGVFTPALDARWKSGVFAPPHTPVTPVPVTVAAATGGLESVAGGGRAAQNTFDAVLYDIGRRSELSEREPRLLTASSLPNYEAIDRDSWYARIGRGRAIVDRVETMLHQIICSDGAAEVKERAKIQQALGQSITTGREDMIGVICRIGSANLLIPEHLSRSIAEIVVDHLAGALQPGGGADQQIGNLCTLWGRRLYERHAATKRPDTGPATSAAASPAGQSAGSASPMAADAEGESGQWPPPMRQPRAEAQPPASNGGGARML